MTPDARREAMRALGLTLERVDVAAYEAVGADPSKPVLGAGDRRCRVGVFGRDPGRHEVKHQRPFVGAGGQKVRKALYEAAHGVPMPGFEASLQVGELVFWANTVPYKPLGNKVWPKRVRDAFRPLITDLLVHGWEGRDLLVMGRVALQWFGVDRDTRARLNEHWARDDCFASSIEVQLTAPDGVKADMRLHPLPHPSPLNATWAPHFHRLMRGRLDVLGFSATSWMCSES